VTKDLIELYYDIYNPAPTEIQRVMLDTSAYTTPIVEPAVEIPAPAPQEAGLPADRAPQPPPQVQPIDPVVVPPAGANQDSLPQLGAQLPASHSNAEPLMPKTALSGSSQNALDGLREVTAKAAQLVNGQSGNEVPK
jgi:hypothetical protein